ncbi:Beta-hexosaminidase subunit A1 [Cyphellophora attinorum]|uniref:beta-N-acetylhexosaminidase n=1 Tax=Cyphellophora attinorum TaxID=1664694 RepID=A0A0N0NPI4_9EURO|nr:Beta-hexosaminidase subunit A1 [Phialophora attinorum]KPI42579.1 Beta-hexosaminidase subunit A1 [Phialophora attinorum]
MISFTWLFVGLCVGLQALPPLPATTNSSSSTSTIGFDFVQAQPAVFITQNVAQYRDQDGLTLVPPSGKDFATIFVQELCNMTGQVWSLEVIDEVPANAVGVYLTQLTDGGSDLKYENGSPTEEGYQLDVTEASIVISGTGSRGVWWGTRTVLQELYLSNFTTVAARSTKDAPAYKTRGYMLDAGRKWYSPSFLKDLCTYASFFKMSEFHYHVSDNYPLNRGHNETWQDIYSQFSLRPENPELLDGLIERVNETLSREEYADLELHCANHGIAVIPEIEAPGHCLTITKWKPELALPKRDLLNLSHPDSIPTVKQIWDEFLPWFNVKEIHIGADEYNASLGDVYVGFVNELADYVKTTNNKSVRAWGTPFDSPAGEGLRISPDVIIQHWQHGQSDPLQLVAQGHQVINSEDWWAYTSIKSDHMPILPAKYPQFFNNSRILNFADEEGWQWEPSLFNQVNVTDQLSPNSIQNKGAIMASWNDNGPDASTQLEAYYIWRRGIPIVAARAWSGSRGAKLDPETIDQSIDFLSAHAPGQNLDRTTPSPVNASAPLLTWTAPPSSSNIYHLNKGSKGLNHTLHLKYTGPFTLSGPDTILALDGSGHLIYTSDGIAYPLRSVSATDGFDPGHPGRIWWNGTSSSHEEVVLNTTADCSEEHDIVITTTAIDGSRVWIDGEWAGRFEVFVFGGRNTVFSWNQMAFVAPLDTVEGTGLKALRVWDGVREVDDVRGWNDDGAPVVYTPGSGSSKLRTEGWLMVLIAELLAFVVMAL